MSVDTELLVQSLRKRGHTVEAVIKVPDNAGDYEFVVDGVTQVLRPGSVSVIPPNAVHSGRALTDCRILDVFCPVREDYIQFER